MNKILPPGSTSTELQTEINNADSGDIIIISSDMQFTDTYTVIIPADKEITIQSDTGNNWTLLAPPYPGRHFTVYGSLILQDITLDGGSVAGGIDGFDRGTITINSNTTIKNCYNSYKGGGVNTSGAFIMNGGNVIGNKSDSYGGGVYVDDNDFIMNGGNIIENKAYEGGGLYQNHGNGSMFGGSISNNTAEIIGGGIFGGLFTLSGGEISGNKAGVAGGICIINELNISGGKIINNASESYAGGVYYGIVKMTGGEISGNTAAPVYYYGYGGGGAFTAGFYMSGGILSGNVAINGNGGGLVVPPGCVFNMSGGVISDNEATNGNGGGVHVMHELNGDKIHLPDGLSADGNGIGRFSQRTDPADVSLSGYFVNNRALNGNGGAVCTEDMTYGNIITSAETVFSCNRASTAHQPPADAGTLYPDIRFASTTITDHVLNNYDINYTVGVPIDGNFYVTYTANGGSGSYTGPGIAPCQTDIVLSSSEAGISRPGYNFTGWNTEPDGSGIEYNPGDIINLDSNVTLYAQWVDAIFSITYGANGGSGSFEDTGRQYGTYYTILSRIQTGVSRPGFTFIGWNTKPDGSGTSFTPGDVVTITGDVRLYAQWRRNSMPKPVKVCRKAGLENRKNIEGQKIWDDDDNIDGKRPANVEILLLRDGEIYKRTLVNSSNGWAFGFCCLPIMNNSGHNYDYQIDETIVPGYTKKIEGYKVTNTINP